MQERDASLAEQTNGDALGLIDALGTKADVDDEDLENLEAELEDINGFLSSIGHALEVGSPDDAANQRQVPGPWVCTACTYENESTGATCCEVCETPRRSSS